MAKTVNQYRRQRGDYSRSWPFLPEDNQAILDKAGPYMRKPAPDAWSPVCALEPSHLTRCEKCGALVERRKLWRGEGRGGHVCKR